MDTLKTILLFLDFKKKLKIGLRAIGKKCIQLLLYYIMDKLVCMEILQADILIYIHHNKEINFNRNRNNVFKRY